MTAEQLHKMLDDFEAWLRARVQDVGQIEKRWQMGEMTPEDTDFCIDWQDDFGVLVGRLTELADTCNAADGMVREILYK